MTVLDHEAFTVLNDQFEYEGRYVLDHHAFTVLNDQFKYEGRYLIITRSLSQTIGLKTRDGTSLQV